MRWPYIVSIGVLSLLNMWLIHTKDARIATDQDVIIALLGTQACYIAGQMSDGSPADCRDKWEKQRLAFEAWDKVAK